MPEFLADDWTGGAGAAVTAKVIHDAATVGDGEDRGSALLARFAPDVPFDARTWGGVSYVFGKLTAFASFFNGFGNSPRYHDDGASLSARYAVTSRWGASLGYTFMRDRSGGGNDADQFSAGCEYDVSPTVLFYASAAELRNRGTGTFTLRGVAVRPGRRICVYCRRL